ncbi:DUF1109 domain-containing protein [Sphingomonas sp. CGMCC 1.13654]|uniref:DUF1109 domain-containing protein n=1 Tax=Sphingomonas chungangi TaxID=2683589 RepID=A0A838L4P1_9SPHN|nr:DUF1109 domain-containing protein [Sphingomonas chungangi]MBA2933176.1 DUF1109 domain-containing protein [Sphingomonas chungangi]MVW57848.1 DUF1109 family protein [Sphingomonas chungangi]
MTSERLLDELASGLTPVRCRSAGRDGLIVGGLAVSELTLFLMMGLARPDMHHAMGEMSFWWKLATLGLLTVLAVTTAVRSFDPAVSPSRGLRWAAALAVIALLIGWGIDASHHASRPLLARLEWREGVNCLAWMVLLSLPMLAALAVLMRRGAPTHRRGSAMAAGLGAAAWGAFVFFFACGHDDPLYIVFWYGLGCVLVGLAGRTLLPFVARW